jgi:phage I-like protein
MSKAPKRSALNLIALFQGDMAAEPAEGQKRVLPTEFRIFQAGVNTSTKGEFMFDAESAALVMAAYEAHGADLMIDWDHHALLTGQGVRAPAAGWCSLEVRNGELMAVNVKWSDEGAEDLQGGAYRYFSPVFFSDESSGRITRLVNLALCNVPALDGLDALVAASAVRHPNETAAGEPTMSEQEQERLRARNAELETLTASQATKITSLSEEIATLKPASSMVVALSGAFGLAATAPAADVQARVVALSGFQQTALEIAGEKDPTKALGTLGRMKAESVKLGELEKTIAGEKQVALSESFTAGLKKASEDKKIDPSDGVEHMGQRGWWLKYEKENGTPAALSMLSGFVPAAPKQVAGADDRRPAEPKLTALSQAEIDIAKATNSDPEKVKAFKAKKAAAGARA